MEGMLRVSLCHLKALGRFRLTNFCTGSEKLGGGLGLRRRGPIRRCVAER